MSKLELTRFRGHVLSTDSKYSLERLQRLAKHRFHTQTRTRPIVFQFIKGRYSTRRRHTSIHFLGSPQSHNHASA